jgi:Integrase core domain
VVLGRSIYERSVTALEIRTAPRSPWQNPCAERLVGSIRRECLDHFIILNARHLKLNPHSYFSYCHGSRTHLGLDQQCPFPQQVSGAGRIVQIPQLGGLHHRYGYTTAMNVSQREGLGADGIMANDTRHLSYPPIQQTRQPSMRSPMATSRKICRN